MCDADQKKWGDYRKIRHPPVVVVRHAFPRSEFEHFPNVPGNNVQEELTGLLDKVDALGAAWAGPLQAAAMAVGQLASTFVTFRSCCAPGNFHC
jgi:hypothetical protein